MVLTIWQSCLRPELELEVEYGSAGLAIDNSGPVFISDRAIESDYHTSIYYLKNDPNLSGLRICTQYVAPRLPAATAARKRPPASRAAHK